MGFFRKKKAEAENNDNPYANPMTPYQQARKNMQDGLPAAGEPSSSSSEAPPPPYSNQQASGGYGSDRYGAANGYGEKRYQNYNNAAFNVNQNVTANVPSSASLNQRQGGYGGLGSNDERGDTGALFGDAHNRYDPQQQQQSGPPGAASMGPSRAAPDDSSRNQLFSDAGNRYGSQSAAASNDAYDGYGAPRELTEEEQEEQEVNAMQSEMKALRKEDAGRMKNAAQISNDAVRTAMGTMARLGEQDERLYNTEKNLDIAANHNRIAEERTKGLKKYNGSMFAIHVNNPFTSKKRTAELDAKILSQHQADRDTREGVRREAFRAAQEHEETFKGATRTMPRQRLGVDKAAHNDRYNFNNDSEDEENEAEIAESEEVLGGNVGLLHNLAVQMGGTVDRQNGVIDRIGGKSDAVDDGILMNRGKLSRAAHGKS